MKQVFAGKTWSTTASTLEFLELEEINFLYNYLRARYSSRVDGVVIDEYVSNVYNKTPRGALIIAAIVYDFLSERESLVIDDISFDSSPLPRYVACISYHYLRGHDIYQHAALILWTPRFEPHNDFTAERFLQPLF